MTELVLPDDADPNEAAAIAAALSAYLQESSADDEDADESVSWSGRRWAYAGRLKSTAGRERRVPNDAPANPWAAAGRARWMR
jgi:hypothetical protein